MVNVDDNGRLEEIRSQISASPSACEYFRAATGGVAQLFLDFFKLALPDHRTDFDIEIRGRPDTQLLCFLHAQLDETVCHRLFDVDPLDRKACLTTIREPAPNGGAGGDIEIGIAEHNHRVFAAQLEHRGNKFSGAGLRDSCPRRDASSKENFVRPSIDQRRANMSVALNNLDEILRKSGACKQFAHERTSGGSEFRRLQQHGVPRSQCGNDLRGRNHKRVIPRRNYGEDAMGFVLDPAGFCLYSEIVVRHALGAQPPRRPAREEVSGVKGDKQFRKNSFHARLAGFSRDDIDDFFARFEDRVTQTPQEFRSFTQRATSPTRLRFAGTLEDSRQLAHRRRRDSRHHRASSGIDGVDERGGRRIEGWGDRRVGSHGSLNLTRFALFREPRFHSQHQVRSRANELQRGSACWRDEKPARESVGSGYSIETRYRPSGGTVGPERARSRASKSCGISSGSSLPFPTSSRVPTILRTI